MSTKLSAGAGSASGSAMAVRVFLAALLLGAAVLAVQLSRQRAFQVDEVEHVHATYNLEDGRMIYRDFWEGHNPLLYGLLKPLVDRNDAVGSFRRARALPLLVLAAIVAVCGFVAYRLRGEVAAWLASGFAATHSTMVERGMEVRPDGLLGLAAVSALALEISNLSPRRRSAWAALVLGLAFLATQKAAFVCLGFGLYWGYQAFRAREARRLLEPAFIGVLPFLALLAWLRYSGALEDYWRVNVGDAAMRVARKAAVGGEFSPAVYLVHEGRFNLLFSALAVMTLIAVTLRARRRRTGNRELGLTALAWLLIVSLWLNPFPFPYLHVTVLPVLFVLVAVYVTERLSSAGGTWMRSGLVTAAMLLTLAAATSLPRLANRLDGGLDRQMGVLREVQRITEPTDTVFDLVGLYFRPDAYPVWVMTGVGLARYYAGIHPPMVPRLLESAPVVVMLNYRTLALREEEADFLRANYVHHDGPIFVHGLAAERFDVGEVREFRALKSMRFRWEGSSPLYLDGKLFEEGPISKGEHHLTVESAVIGGRLVPASATRERKPAAPFDLYRGFD